MHPLIGESIAGGEPVTGVARSDLRETKLHDETGLRLSPDFRSVIAATVTDLTSAKDFFVCNACTTGAELFSHMRFPVGPQRVLES